MQYNLWQVESRPSWSFTVRSLISASQTFFGIFLRYARVPFFQIYYYYTILISVGIVKLNHNNSYYSFTMTLQCASALNGHRLCQLVSLIYGRGARVPRGAPQVDPQCQLGLVCDFSPPCPCSSLLYFILLFNYYFCVHLFLFFTFAVPMCEVYCVGYTPRAWDLRPFPKVHAELSLVFQTTKQPCSEVVSSLFDLVWLGILRRL